MKVLFVMEHPGVASLVPSLELLADHGHEVRLAYESVKSAESRQELEAFLARRPEVTLGQLPRMGHDGWVPLAGRLRRGVDYLRYLDPRYPEASRLRTRAESKAPAFVRRVGRVARALGPTASTALLRSLQAVERCLPPAPRIVRYLEEERPDVLLLAHLLPLGAPHADYLRAAKRLGIPTVFPVRGWDNLTNKGLLRDAPDLLLVWNDLQAREAEELHRIPRENVRLTGAFRLDQWFRGKGATRSREQFCDEVGLPPERPIVLYVCSSGFVARDEVAFVRSWIARLRERGGVFADVAFLVRPHPLNAAQWSDADLGDPYATVWPRFGEAPHDEQSQANFFDSIYHSAAVVGINTTAQIESAIVGRPTHTLLADEFLETQQGTLHFHYLKDDEFGLLYVGRTFDEHAAQLEESLRGDADDGRNERFVHRFVRPLGLERSGAELVVEAMEELAARPVPAPERGPALAPLVRVLMRPFAAAAVRDAARRAERHASERTPLEELRVALRKRVLNRSGAPVVAPPWAGSDVDELLLWIPFLRAAQASHGLGERLFVICRASREAWYEGIGARRLAVEQLGDTGVVGGDELRGSLRDRVASELALGSRAFRVFPVELVEPARAELARGRSGLLEYAPFAAAKPPDRYVGPYDAAAIVAILTGAPAFVTGPVPDDDRRLISTFLGAPPYGAFHEIESVEAVEHLLPAPVA